MSICTFYRECSFVSKALTAQHAGALFVIIADNDIGSTTLRIEMVHDETGRPVNIPALLIAGKDGWVHELVTVIDTAQVFGYRGSEYCNVLQHCSIINTFYVKYSLLICLQKKYVLL